LFQQLSVFQGGPEGGSQVTHVLLNTWTLRLGTNYESNQIQFIVNTKINLNGHIFCMYCVLLAKFGTQIMSAKVFVSSYRCFMWKIHYLCCSL
jgi:hypothetical protein